MNKQLVEAITQFRYGLISEIVCRIDMARGDQHAILQEAASREYRLPNSEGKTRLSMRTLERYLAAYRKDGVKGLEPCGRLGRPRAIEETAFAHAELMRRELPSRSVDTIIRMLELSGITQPGVIKRSTLAEHLKRQGLTRQKLTRKKADECRRYGRAHRNEVWQGDVYDMLRLPVDETTQREVHLVAFIDDHSRLLVHGEFYFDEKMPRIEDCLKKAILKYGKPERLYVDNAQVYSGAHIGRICSRLGMHLSHATVYRPCGKGKLERFFGYVENSFRPEAELLIRKGQLHTLDELNTFFRAWLDVAYNMKRHSTTKQMPLTAYEADPTPVRRVDDLDAFLEAFLYEDERSVDKTGVIHLHGNTYEVDRVLAKQKIALRFDPYDMTAIQVWHGDNRYQDAIPIDLTRLARPGVPKKDAEVEAIPNPPIDSGFTYIELLKRDHDGKHAQGPGISYRRGAIARD